MPITFKDDDAIIVYALECVIALAKRTQQIFVAQCVWWLALNIGLEQNLVSHIDSLQGQRNTTPAEQVPRDYPQESRRLGDKAALKVSGKTTTSRINPTSESKKNPRRSKRVPKSPAVEIEGVEISEIKRRKAADECLRCAWPSDRKGIHWIKDCRRPIKLDKGTAPYARKNQYQKPVTSSDERSFEDSTDSGDSSGSPI